MRCDATSRPKHFKLVQFRFAYQYEQMYKLFFLRVLGAHVLESTQAKPQQVRTQFKPKQTRETVARRANKPKKTQKKKRNATLDTKSQNKIRKNKTGKKLKMCRAMFV